MEEVLLTGVSALDDASKLLFVHHCVDSSHWAGGGKKRKHMQIMDDTVEAASNSSKGKVANQSQSASKSAKSKKTQSQVPGASATAAAGSTIVAGSFTVLAPGVDGALANDELLKGQTFVISGTFPEVGGGDEDAVGVAIIKAMIESYGGKVISRFSKNTSEYMYHANLSLLHIFTARSVFV